MEELKTANGIDVELSTRSILYLCHLNDEGIKVVHSIQFKSKYQGFEAYSEIRNPESQLITGATYDELITNMHKLHSCMNNQSWLESLRESI